MAPLRFQLVMRSGPTPGKTYDLDKDEVSIGRDVNNDVVINDAEVSRRHAQINRQPGSFAIEDLGSTNGTFVNRVRLSGTRVLQPSDSITLGENVSLAFELVQEEPEFTVVASHQPERETPPTPAADFPGERFTQPEMERQPPPYSSHIPPSPAEAQPPAPRKSRSDNRMLFGCIGLTVLLCILVVLALVIIDQLNIWCDVMPFLPGC
ncbi:MAG: FHA domain-containing protein [Anaerolineales bacterium]